MKLTAKIIATFALCTSALGVHAATVRCPDPIGGSTGFTRQVEVTGALAGGECYYKEGNFQGDNFSSFLGNSYTLIDKDVVPDQGPASDTSEGLLYYTTNAAKTGGTWAMASNLWTNHGELFLAMHFGNGSGTPDSFIVELGPFATSGTYALIPTNLANGLSNIYLIGRGPSTCAPNCGGGGDEIPEPASLALAAIGLLGAGLARRRRNAKA